MSGDREELTQRLIDLVSTIGQRARTGMPAEWPDIELTMPQLRTLAILSAGPTRMSDLASQIGSSLPATTSMVDRLVEKNLVERSHGQTDRRVVECRLTTAGQHFLDEFWRVRAEAVREMAEILSDGELRVVVQAMEILADAAERRADSDSAAPR